MLKTLKKRLNNAHRDAVAWQRLPVVGPLVRGALFGVFGVDIPASVRIGERLFLLHGGRGVVVHRFTRIGDRVTIFHDVTIGLAELGPEPAHVDIEIADRATLCAGARILAPASGIRVGRNTVIGANAVLTRSTGDNEVWAGVPARKIGERKPVE